MGQLLHGAGVTEGGVSEASEWTANVEILIMSLWVLDAIFSLLESLWSL